MRNRSSLTIVIFSMLAPFSHHVLLYVRNNQPFSAVRYVAAHVNLPAAYRLPSYSEWIGKEGESHGLLLFFELICALS